MESKLELKEGVNHILEGKLPEPINFKRQEIFGTINAPSEFWNKRLLEIDIDRDFYSSDKINYNYDAAYIEFDYGNNTIKLTVNAAHPGEIIVNGSFIVNRVFNELKINKDDPYSNPNELLATVRYKSELFETITGHADLVKNLRNFTAKATKDFKQWSDQKGNTGTSKSIELIEFTPLAFEIFVPIFNGEPKNKIKVEVEIEDRNGSLVFFLVSMELPRLMEDYKGKKFLDLKEDFTGIAIIDK
jgi:hypothetical protein